MAASVSLLMRVECVLSVVMYVSAAIALHHHHRRRQHALSEKPSLGLTEANQQFRFCGDGGAERSSAFYFFRCVGQRGGAELAWPSSPAAPCELEHPRVGVAVHGVQAPEGQREGLDVRVVLHIQDTTTTDSADQHT